MKKHNNFNKFLKYMWSNSKKYTIVILFVQISTLVIAYLGLLVAQIIQMFIDDIIVKQNTSAFSIYLKYFFIIYSTILILSIINNYLNPFINQKINFSIRHDFFKSIECQDYTFFRIHSFGDIYYRMFQDVSSMTNFFFNLILAMPIQIIYVVIVLKKMLIISKSLTLYAVVLLGIQIVCVLIFKKPTKILIGEQKKVEQNVVSKITEQFSNVVETKLLGLEKFQISQFDSFYNNYVKVNIKNSFLLKLFSNITEFINQFWYIGALLISAFISSKGEISIGNIFSFIIIVKLFFSPVLNLLHTILSFQDCRISYQRYFEYYKQPSKFNKNFSFMSSLTISNLSYTYMNDNKKIFDSVSMVLEKDQLIAIKGHSGIGKTTLLRLVARFLQPQEGSIKIDNIDIHDIDTYQYFHNIGFLPQNPIIFNASIRDNLILDQQYTNQEIIDVLETVGLNHFVSNLPENIDSIVGLSGIKLSEGQAQRIALARILLRKPKILYLDEPTAQLDLVTKETIIQAAIRFQKKYKALVIINTHDPTIMDIADKVYEIFNFKINLIK